MGGPTVWLPAHGAGLVIVGPSRTSIDEVERLKALPGVVSIEAGARALATWRDASAEALLVSRQASVAMRRARIVLVYLDAHLDADIVLQPDEAAFVSARLGQIVMGLADQPAYLALSGPSLASSVVLEHADNGVFSVVGTVSDSTEIWELANGTMFPGLAVGVLGSEHDASAMRETIEWFEAQRT